VNDEISGHVAAHVVSHVRGRGGDAVHLADAAGLRLADLIDGERWFPEAELASLLLAARRLYPAWNVAFEAGKTALRDGLADLRDASLVFRETPDRLIDLFCGRYAQFHRSLDVAVRTAAKTSSVVEVSFRHRAELTRDVADFVSGVIHSIPELLELREYRVVEEACAVLPRNLKHLGGRMVRVTAGGEVLEYAGEEDRARGRARVLGKVAADGRFTYGGIAFGAERSRYRLEWAEPHWFRKVAGFTSRERLRNTAARLDQARQVIALANDRITQVEGELAESRRTLEALSLFHAEAKGATSLTEILNLITLHACSGFGMDRATMFLVRGGHLEIVSCYDPRDVEAAQRAFAELSRTPIPLSEGGPETEAVRSGNAMAVNDAWGNLRVWPALRDAWKPRAYAVLPIWGKDRVIGVLDADCLYHDRPVDRGDIARLQKFTAAVGMAMEKIAVIGTLEEKVDERTTALQAANRKLAQLYQSSRESERAKSDYLANMSHELRTPLNAIIGFSKLMLHGAEGEVSDKQRDDLNAIHQAGLHLLELINDLLDLSKIEAGKMDLRREHFDPNGVVGEVVETVKGLAAEKGLTLTGDLDRELPFLYADRIRVRQVLMNLASNAIKYTDAGSVTIKTQWQAPHVYFGVIDTGRGMRKEEIERAFVEFSRIASGKRDRQQGTGLGLTISRRFVEMHEGRIWVSSTPGVGSTFHVLFPSGS
jgi:signal transduction histidine kinase